MKHYCKEVYQTYDTIILANGAFPSSQEACFILNKWEAQPELFTFVCCDGAINNLSAYTETPPDLIIGDLDSISDNIRGIHKHRLIHIAEQETNDLAKALRHLNSTFGRKKIVLLGATGKREDHTLGNLALLISYASLVEEVVALTDTGYFLLITQDSTVEVGNGTSLSVFCFSPSPITLTGVNWPVREQVLPYLFSGTLNRANQDIISIKTTAPLLLFVAHHN